MVGRAVTRCGHELRRNVHAGHLALRLAARDRERKLARTATYVESPLELEFPGSLQKALCEHSKAAIRASPLGRPAVAGPTQPFVRSHCDGILWHCFPPRTLRSSHARIVAKYLIRDVSRRTRSRRSRRGPMGDRSGSGSASARRDGKVIATRDA